MSIRPGPWSNGRRLLCLKSCFLLDQVDGWVLVHCLPGQEMARDALCEESMSADVVLCSGQCCAAKLWALAFMWRLF